MLKGMQATTGEDYPLNITTLIRHAARNFPDREVVHRTNDGTWHRSTYREEWRRLARMAHVLSSLGIGPGDVVGVMDWNSRRHFELYFAVPGLAAVMLQLNLRLAAQDLRYVIDHSGASWICVDESLLPIAEQHADAENVRGWIILSDRPGSQVSTTLPRAVFLEDLMADLDDSADQYPWELIDEHSAAYAGYTTGTTGRPKGIFYSHRAMYLHSLALISALQVGPEDCVMPVTPMFHVMSWGFPQASVAAGAKVVLPGRYGLDELDFLADAMVQEEVTVANGAPAIFGPVLEHIRGLDQAPDLSRVRLVCGATEPPLAMMKGYKELTGADVVHAYGASETSPVVTYNYRLKPGMEQLDEEQRWDIKRCQGVPVLGLEIKIADLEGDELPADGATSGELLVRGPWVTVDYHDRPDAAESFRDGWWHSGDVGVMRPDGYLKLTDRLKDVIKSGGEWISSIDLENAILDNARVAEAAVIGVPHPRWQERPVAYVVARPGAELTEEIVLQTLRGRFADWQLPDRVILVEELPKTSVGKLNKKLMREQFAAS